MNKYRIAIYSMLFFLLTGCATVKEKFVLQDNIIKRTLSDRAGSNFIIKADRNNEKTGELRSFMIAGAVITGYVQQKENKDIEFIIKSIKLISNWHNGWTDGECIAKGKIIFSENKSGIRSNIAHVEEPFELSDAVKGEVRYKENFYRGEEGRKRFKQRMDRIEEVVKFLKSRGLKEFYGAPRMSTVYGKSFREETGPLLFPEIYGFNYLSRKGQLDRNFNLNDLDISDDIVFADEMIFRKSYTKKIFPEILQEIRNTGTMWKDYEEALDLFFILYNLEYFFGKVLDKSEWIKTI